LVSKHPWFAQRWTAADQPDVVRLDKRPLRLASLGEYAKDAVTLMLSAPLVATAFLMARKQACPPVAPREFIGVAVSPFTGHDHELPALIAQLGVRHLLLRVPVWDRDRLDSYATFMRRFPGCTWLVAVVQDRGSVCRPARWRDDLRAIFTTLGNYTSWFQLPLAPNRTKWGCMHMGEALDLLEGAEMVRREFPAVRLVGPGVIDFEPATWLRGLVNRRRFQLDAASALLYVDRRGGPRNRQYGLFDLAGKLQLWKAIMAISPRCRQRARTPLFITEVNWPLTGSGDHGPTSEDEEVDEDTAAHHLLEYFRIAHATGHVQRVYWWQLVQRGYGLVDDRDGRLRPRPGFTAMRDLLAGTIPLTPVQGA
jgi:hypothetical protein